MKTHITLLCCLCCWLGFGQSISEVEYFFNTDPGIGNATTLSFNANTGEITQTFSITVPTDAVGFNTLYIRAKDNTNVWSLYDNRLFYITDTQTGQTATEITAVEYFINSDPGFGNATALTFNSNTGNITENYAIPIGSDLNGFNTLYIRTQDDLGNWSLYDAVKFYVTEELGTGSESVTAIEYFIDTDPGFGNATTINVGSNSGSTTETLAIPLGTLEEGFHNLYIRTQDDLGEWSLYDKRLFFVTPVQEVSPIVAAEYFYDSDPGLGNGTSVALTPTGSLNEFTVDLSTANITCDFHDFYIRLINEDGSWSLYDYGLQIEVFDNANPTIVVFDNITVELDTNGETSLTIADVDNGTFDDCELASVVLNQTQFNYNCDDLGANMVTITATDAENKVSTQDVTITVVDNINPIAVAQDITVQLDVNGTATITANELENGSTDNCSIASRSIDVSSFDCSDLGINTVNFTVTDTSGNTNSITATVTVEDSVLPTAATQNMTVQLDASGNASIIADDVDVSTDNCSIVSKSLDISSFDCTNIGTNTVTLTVTDQSGNSSAETAIITVEDTIAPTVVTQNITVQLDANGNASINTADVDNGSSDNCAIASLALDTTSFTCDDIGAFDVVLTVTDQSGNTDTATATVFVEDNVAPSLTTQDITVALGADGTVTVDAFEPVMDAGDNCLLDVFLDNDFFDCDDLGANSVTLTASDGSGNSIDVSATITVVDNIDPIALGQDITLDLNGQPSVSIVAADIDNGSSDNCNNTSLSIDQDTFTMPGTYTVTLTITDSSGNTDAVTVTVTVTDSTLSIDTVETNDKVIVIYPNPTDAILHIKTDATIKQINVFDISGKQILKTTQSQNTIDVSQFNNGVYFIQFKTENHTINKRFIKH